MVWRNYNMKESLYNSLKRNRISGLVQIVIHLHLHLFFQVISSREIRSRFSVFPFSANSYSSLFENGFYYLFRSSSAYLLFILRKNVMAATFTPLITTQLLSGNSSRYGTRNWTQPFQWDNNSIEPISLRIRSWPLAMLSS